MEFLRLIREQLEASAELKLRVADWNLQAIDEAARLIIQSLEDGGKLLLCGNGGSAADAQHLAAEFVGRFRCDRRALPAIALMTDGCSFTAVSNDYGFDQSFARQLAALGRSGDVLLALSTSGNSANVILAAHEAARRGLFRIALTGDGGGELARGCDIVIAVPSRDVPRIQEAHITIGHILCDIVEQALFERPLETTAAIVRDPPP